MWLKAQPSLGQNIYRCFIFVTDTKESRSFFQYLCYKSNYLDLDNLNNSRIRDDNPCYIILNKAGSEDMKAVRDDLQGLEITPQELRSLTNLPVKHERPNITRYFQKKVSQWIGKLQGSEGPTAVFLGLSLCVVIYIFLGLVINLLAIWLPLPPMPSWILIILFGCLFVYGGKLFVYLLWKHSKKMVNANMTPSLEVLLKDVDRYNAVIKAIDINDKIEAVGNTEVVIQDRERVTEALEMARIDLVRALKTEKILRENQRFIISNHELFTDNLANLTATYVNEKASEHGKLLNEALQIALEVKDEMRKLQNHR